MIKNMGFTRRVKSFRRSHAQHLQLLAAALLIGAAGTYLLTASKADANCSLDLDHLSVSSGCPITGSDTAASGSQSDIESLWGQIGCADISRLQLVTGGGDPRSTVNGTPQSNSSFYQSTVLNGDNFYGSRCELGRNERRFGQNGGKGTFQLYQQGQHKITFVSIKLPANFQANQNLWQTILQMKQTEPDNTVGSSPILELDASNGLFMINSDPAGTLWTTPVVTGQWVRFALDVTYSQNKSEGKLKVYADLNGDGDTTDTGEQSPTITTATLATEAQVSLGDPPLLQVGDPVPSHLRLGLYHNPSYNCPAPNGCSIDDDNIQVIDLTNTPVTTAPLPDKVPPTVYISSPTQGTVVSGSVYLTAMTSDNVGVSRVEFFADGQKIATATQKPFTALWDANGVQPGDHSITAKAYDMAGNSATATTVTVKINPSSSPATLRGDVTGMNGVPDGKIDLSDISYVIRKYDTADTRGDISGPNGTPDGKVDLYDLSYIIRNYEK